MFGTEDETRSALGHDSVAGTLRGDPQVLRLLSKGMRQMPRESSTRLPPLTLPSQWLVLALVMERSSHAYEIGTRYKRRFGSFAPTAQNAVYVALDRLAERGFVTEAISTGTSNRRNRRVIYIATSAGIEAHRRWLLSSIQPTRWRTELLARIATGGALKRSELLALVNIYEQMLVASAQQIDVPPQIEEREANNVVMLRRLAAREQLAIARAQLRWVKAARVRLQGGST